MATTVTGTKPIIKTGFGGGSKPRGPNGNSSPKRNGYDDAARIQSSANRYRIGMWVGMASILMMFTALTSAYIVRSGSSNDWQPLAMPRVMWLSTALIIVQQHYARNGSPKTKRRVSERAPAVASCSAPQWASHFCCHSFLPGGNWSGREFTFPAIHTVRSSTS